MAAGNYTFIIEQGSTTDFQVEWTDSNGSKVDLTNYSARMHIRTSYGGTLICALSSTLHPDGTGLNLSGSNNQTSPTSGSVGIYISAATSSGFTFGDAKYDLEMVSGSSPEYVTRLLQGNIKLSKNITI